MRIRKRRGMETFCSFVNFQKAFDFVNHDFLLNKIYNIGIDGKTYKTIKEIYKRPVSCVLVGDRLTDWFPSNLV